MIKLAGIYGIITGLVIIVISTLSYELGVASVWLGYLIMLIAFSVIFVAVKQHRDQALGGIIRRRTAFAVGLGITVVASVVYVAVWELYLAVTDYVFIDEYIASILADKRAAGASPAELAAAVAETDKMRAMYASPWQRLPITFIEIFPVGVLMSLIAAFALKDSAVLRAD
ncbi:DUF4199 domain-containing protein [Woeseia oceani]|uniref:DUF4199 domain-containing protein n=1 Tax=Woeseia oceani TaxID=1548547 RepID=A0A193LHR4_9GAMM|nr:DUF4199 domain-containing protein [Woeseia oceani]ANO52036.1 hypothetical protein BA177_13245 [Woeseia oceani]